MRYLCPICRAPQQETIENICVTYWVTLCDGCYKQFMPGGTSDTPPPFPWKRRARGIRYRALCTARSLQPQRVEYVARRVRTGYYNPLDAVITRDGSDVEAPRNRFVTFSNGELAPVYADAPVLGAWIRQPQGAGGDSPPST